MPRVACPPPCRLLQLAGPGRCSPLPPAHQSMPLHVAHSHVAFPWVSLPPISPGNSGKPRLGNRPDLHMGPRCLEHFGAGVGLLPPLRPRRTTARMLRAILIVSQLKLRFPGATHLKPIDPRLKHQITPPRSPRCKVWILKGLRIPPGSDSCPTYMFYALLCLHGACHQVVGEGCQRVCDHSACTGTVQGKCCYRSRPWHGRLQVPSADPP